ncbi:glutamine amidotransferase-related protein [Spirosoma arcticum]
MNKPFSIALLGDYNPAYEPHVKAVEVLQQWQLSVPFSFTWIPTAQLVQQPGSVLAHFSGVWAGSGPYKSKTGVLNGIRYARQNNIPFLGTCSGLGYAVLEFGQHLFNLASVNHPDEGVTISTEHLFLEKLTACGLGWQDIAFSTVPGTLTQQIYGAANLVNERSHCSYGLHPAQADVFAQNGMIVSARDATGEVKMLEYSPNGLFLAMLFYPQLNHQPGRPHPILQAFLQKAAETSHRHATYA